MHCTTKTRPRRRSIRWLEIFICGSRRQKRNSIQAIRDTFGDILACVADDGGIDPKWESDAEYSLCIHEGRNSGSPRRGRFLMRQDR